jgi:hypothetical protein
MDDTAVEITAAEAYEPPRILASYDAADILAQAETGSVIIVIS